VRWSFAVGLTENIGSSPRLGPLSACLSARFALAWGADSLLIRHLKRLTLLTDDFQKHKV